MLYFWLQMIFLTYLLAFGIPLFVNRNVREKRLLLLAVEVLVPMEGMIFFKISPPFIFPSCPSLDMF